MVRLSLFQSSYVVRWTLVHKKEMAVNKSIGAQDIAVSQSMGSNDLHPVCSMLGSQC